MRHSIRLLCILTLALTLAVPALAQTGSQPGGSDDAASRQPRMDGTSLADSQQDGVGDMTRQQRGPDGGTGSNAAVDPDKAYRLHLEYMAKTAELHGKIMARTAELELLLVNSPDDTAAVNRLTGEIATLAGQLYQQTTLFRIRYAKETGTPIHYIPGFGFWGGHGGMMDGHGRRGGQGMQCGCMPDGKGHGMMGMMGGGHDGMRDGHDGMAGGGQTQ